jgi:hypothetical protein
VSPPHPNLRGELAEILLPPGSSIAYDVSPLPGLEHHLWMLEGALSLEIDAVQFHLQKETASALCSFRPFPVHVRR